MISFFVYKLYKYCWWCVFWISKQKENCLPRKIFSKFNLTIFIPKDISVFRKVLKAHQWQQMILAGKATRQVIPYPHGASSQAQNNLQGPPAPRISCHNPLHKLMVSSLPVLLPLHEWITLEAQSCPRPHFLVTWDADDGLIFSFSTFVRKNLQRHCSKFLSFTTVYLISHLNSACKIFHFYYWGQSQLSSPHPNPILLTCLLTAWALKSRPLSLSQEGEVERENGKAPFSRE